MKKYFLKDNGKEVKFGDFILGTHKFGDIVTKILTPLDEDSIDVLKDLGIVIEKDVKDEKFDIAYSLEELNEQVQNLKDKLDENDSESVFGGLLFGDFGGIPLAQEMTAKETEIYNDQLTVRKIPNEEVEAFESLKQDFDTLMAKYF